MSDVSPSTPYVVSRKKTINIILKKKEKVALYLNKMLDSKHCEEYSSFIIICYFLFLLFFFVAKNSIKMSALILEYPFSGCKFHLIGILKRLFFKSPNSFYV